MDGFSKALEHLRVISDGNGHTKGKLFERLVKSFLETDNLYRERFKEVWLWNDYPDRDGRADFGVDLVGEQKDGSRCAIQCKFFDRKPLTKRDIDSFLEAGSRSEFCSMILFYTGTGYGKKAEDAMIGHKCKVVNLESLAGSNVEWPDLAAGITEVKRVEPYSLRKHQGKAIESVMSGLEKNDRGQLLMACGTGKTLTSLRLAEQMVGVGGLVLYAVPSISLMHQAIRYYSENRTIPHSYIGVCSDVKVSHGERTDIPIIEMEIGVTTDHTRIAEAIKSHDSHSMTILFVTYHSMKAVVEAQKICGKSFDIILSDEAHRTTGVEDKSSFTMIHNDVMAKKRLYMTATPRIYKAASKSRAKKEDKILHSMDDEKIFGPVLHELSFSDAIDQHLLSDYQVIILGVDERYGLNHSIIDTTTDEGDLKLTDAARMLGLYRVLEHPNDSMSPLQTAIVYTNRVRDSKRFEKSFSNLSVSSGFSCDARHVDGTQNASVRAEAIQWLRNSTTNPKQCLILSNAKCLSEGVDVPALDAICFMDPKRSQVEIVQAVGRVMRTAPGKKFGYVIIPIGVPPDEKSVNILNNNTVFKQVWDVLRAMRSHDQTMGIEADMASMRKRPPGKVRFIGVDRNGNASEQDGNDVIKLGELDVPADMLYSKIVEEVGDRRYLEHWASDVADVVQRIQSRIERVIKQPGVARNNFNHFMKGLREIIHDSLKESEGIEMLSQHMVTRRIFNTLFQNDDFNRNNPVSAALDKVVEELHDHGLDTELRDIEQFYRSIENRVSGIDNDARQQVISELYGSFFERAFPKMADRLGIVYTPVEIVDFILKSVDHVSKENFGRGLTDAGVNVIDPFTGTGTFLTRLMSPDLGIIHDDDMERKYRHELFASEIVLLAYYIAAVNCESVYGSRTGSFKQFEGLSLCDTFNPGRLAEHTGDVMAEPKKRIRKQRESEINVVICNPPYSSGQKSASDDNKNVSHPILERHIKNTYTSKARNVGFKGAILNPNNSYIKAIRWTSDRIGESGVIGFITPSGFITGNSEAGIRACLEMEFTDIYCFDLRGDVKGKQDWRREGGKIFGSGSTVGTAITILVKNPAKHHSTIHYHDIGDYLSREEKLEIIKEHGSIAGMEWEIITPDRFYDWLNQRESSDEWDSITPMGSKEGKRGKTNDVMFGMYSSGLSTHRDDWVYNASPQDLEENMRKTIEHCAVQDLDDFDKDVKCVAWSKEMARDLKKMAPSKPRFNKTKIRTALYRPFLKQYLYADYEVMVSTPSNIPSFYPHPDSKNHSIMVPDKIKGEFSTFITDITPDRHIHEASQCFPMRVKKQKDKNRHVVGSQSASQPVSHREPGDNSPGQDQGRILSIHNGNNTGSGSGASRAGIPHVHTVTGGDEAKG